MREIVEKALVTSSVAIPPVVKAAQEASIVTESAFINVDYALVISAISALIYGANRLQEMYYRYIDRQSPKQD